jgi:hypothetical protein
MVDSEAVNGAAAVALPFGRERPNGRAPSTLGSYAYGATLAR